MEGTKIPVRVMESSAYKGSNYIKKIKMAVYLKFDTFPKHVLGHCARISSFIYFSLFSSSSFYQIVELLSKTRTLSQFHVIGPNIVDDEERKNNKKNNKQRYFYQSGGVYF